jgi:hypothetical protein
VGSFSGNQAALENHIGANEVTLMKQTNKKAVFIAVNAAHVPEPVITFAVCAERSLDCRIKQWDSYLVEREKPLCSKWDKIGWISLHMSR